MADAEDDDRATPPTTSETWPGPFRVYVPTQEPAKPGLVPFGRLGAGGQGAGRAGW